MTDVLNPCVLFFWFVFCLIFLSGLFRRLIIYAVSLDQDQTVYVCPNETDVGLAFLGYTVR